MVCKNAAFDGDDVWYIDNNKAINKIGGSERCLFGVIPFEGYYPFCVKYKNKLICLPAIGSGIVVYDIISNNFSKKRISDEIDNALVVRFWTRGSLLWLVEKKSNTLIKYDMEEEIIELYSICNGFDADEIADACIDNKKIYFIFRDSSKIVAFDMENNKTEVFETGVVEAGLNTIAVINDCFYLTGKKAAVYFFNSIDRSTYVLEMDTNRIKVFKEDSIFFKSISYKKSVFFIPYTEPERADSIVILDTEREKFDYLNIITEIFTECDGFRNRFVNILRVTENDKMDIYMDNLPIHRLSMGNKRIEVINDLSIDVSFMKNYYENPYILSESKQCTLDKFIGGLIKNK